MLGLSKTKFFVGVLGLLIATVVAIGLFWQLSVMPYLHSPMQANLPPFHYNFKNGSSLRTIVNFLANKNILSHPKYLLIYARLNNKTRNLHSGIYKIDPKQSPLELLAILENGTIAAFNLRTNEGNNFKQMLISISLEDRLIQTLTDYSAANIMQKIGYSDQPYEGYFYPDTYNLPYSMTDIEFLKQSYEAMRDVLQHEWQNRDKNITLKTTHELLTLASIIEKETNDYQERFKISAVFHNRLNKKMRLQTDPTVIYGMGDKFKGNLRKRDLRTFTPFNTYRINGLPPTPICMPSQAAIQAAAHPDVEANELLYFVAKGKGKHKFSKTYAEHYEAVKKYQIKPFKARRK